MTIMIMIAIESTAQSRRGWCPARSWSALELSSQQAVTGHGIAPFPRPAHRQRVPARKHRSHHARGNNAASAGRWWLRRNLDGTAPLWFEGLDRLLSIYDAKWLAKEKSRKPTAPPKLSATPAAEWRWRRRW